MQQDATAPGYVRRLGAWSAAMMVVGGVIGGGIFVNPSTVAQRTHSGVDLLALWIVGGLLTLAGALCFAELGARRPQAGGSYVYLREAFGSLPAFLFGWTMLLVNYSGSIAAVGMIFARYTCVAVGLPETLVKPIGVGAIVLLGGINAFGIRAGALVQNLFTVLKLLAVAILVVIGLAWAGNGHLGAAFVGDPAQAALPRWALAGALLPVLFSYGGFAYVNNIAGEIREPARNLPRALGLGMLLVLGCYVLVNIAYMSALGHAGLAASDTPAADVMARVFGDNGRRLIAAGIAISTFGYCNIAMIGSARVFQVMGADGVFFRSVARLHPRWHVPNRALAVVAAWAVLLTLSGTYNQLLDYSTVGDWLGYAAAVATLFWYRHTHAGNASAYRTPLYPLTPLLFIATVMVIVAILVITRPVSVGIGLLIIAAGVPVFVLWRRWFSR
ncbi:amino acid permease [Oleiagrimonas soli]|uniref:APA family basic amino acid/polyamine antiporter n=1 Tax=Oleiagrimonas soli TaxID=1543381 RepID=A0A099CUJ9_9GAMM|nr:amino acid permease [Oleiagrimonas soli]KGI77307.1 amino acid permease [Oleiagrimonas soli]MBB6185514.1 APA family basic amino acid/polyamine antiporter [Oleiagrimonas soli]